MNTMNVLITDATNREMSSNITVIKVKQRGLRKNVVELYTGLDGSEFVGEIDLNRERIEPLPEDQ